MIGWTAIYVANETATQAAKGFSFVLYVDHSHHLYIEGTTLNQSQFFDDSAIPPCCYQDNATQVFDWVTG